jgi:beta-lactam-binding protein with PASTA domain
MSTPSDRDPERVVVEDAPTVDTAVSPPYPPAPPPPVAPPPDPVGYPASAQVVIDDPGGRRYVTTATGERVLVDDPGGTRVVTSDVRPPLPPDEDPRRWNWLTPALVFILLAALGIVLAAILLTRDNNNNKSNTTTQAGTNTVTTTVRNNTPPPAANVSIQVPSVVGRSRADAEDALNRAGLAIVVATVPGPAPAGKVLAQNPSAGGTLKSGGQVRINVSDGRGTAAGAGASQTPTTRTATTTPATTAASPTTTAAAPTTTAASSPSTTPSTTPSTQPSTPAATPVNVPSLSGDVKSSVQSLVGKGLLATINYVPSDQPLGTVVSQSPAGGATSKTGTHITLSVASGPGEKEQETVPDASGQTIHDAVGTMNSAGLRLILVKKTVSDKTQAGTVVEQTPSPGAKAPKNAQILVYMGAYKG